jgi:hypothetical protein
MQKSVGLRASELCYTYNVCLVYIYYVFNVTVCLVHEAAAPQNTNALLLLLLLLKEKQSVTAETKWEKKY